MFAIFEKYIRKIRPSYQHMNISPVVKVINQKTKALVPQKNTVQNWKHLKPQTCFIGDWFFSRAFPSVSCSKYNFSDSTVKACFRSGKHAIKINANIFILVTTFRCPILNNVNIFELIRNETQNPENTVCCYFGKIRQNRQNLNNMEYGLGSKSSNHLNIKTWREYVSYLPWIILHCRKIFNVLFILRN